MPDFLKKFFKEEEESFVNITSLIDVIFILLIFFMISTQFKKPSLKLTLPKIESSAQDSYISKKTTVSVTSQEISVNGERVNDGDLEKTLALMKEKNPDILILLECEKTLEFEKTVNVLSKIQNAGISRIGIVHEIKTQTEALK